MRSRLIHRVLPVLVLVPVLSVFAGSLHAQASLGPPWALADEPFCEPQSPDLAALPDGGFWAVWSEQDPQTARYEIRGRELASDARPRTDVVSIDPSSFQGLHPLTAVAPDGDRVVVWNDGDGSVRGRGFAPDGTALGASFELFASTRAPESLVAGPDGDFLVTGLDGPEALATRFTADGTSLAKTREILDENAPRQVLGALLADGGAVLAVRPDPLASPTPLVELWRLGPTGEIADRGQVPGAFETALASRPGSGFLLTYRGGQAVVAELRNADLSLASTFELAAVPHPRVIRPPGLAVSPDGDSFVFAWTEVVVPPQLPSDPPPTPATVMRSERYRFDGSRQGSGQTLFGVEGEWAQLLSPHLAFTPAGRLGVAWWQPNRVIVTPVPPCASSSGAFARSTAPGCGGDPETTLCLQDLRFALTLDWRDPRSGDTGTGHPVDLTGDTGAFWFFDPDNLEMMVKVIDGRPVNDHFWLFYGSLTDVEFTLTVTDRETGVERIFSKEPFVFGSEGDTTAFPSP